MTIAGRGATPAGGAWGRRRRGFMGGGEERQGKSLHLTSRRNMTAHVPSRFSEWSG
jgi:hypothetical protein